MIFKYLIQRIREKSKIGTFLSLYLWYFSHSNGNLNRTLVLMLQVTLLCVFTNLTLSLESYLCPTEEKDF